MGIRNLSNYTEAEHLTIAKPKLGEGQELSEPKDTFTVTSRSKTNKDG